jgi:hypothetical protein
MLRNKATVLYFSENLKIENPVTHYNIFMATG